MTSQILITLFLVLLNGFFVAAEFAIVKVRLSQLEMEVKEGNRFANLSKHIVTHLDGYLAATQLGITLASLGLGWIGEPVVSKIIIATMHAFDVTVNEALAHKIALPIAFIIITILHIVFGELAPKSIAIQRSAKTTLVVAYPLHFFFIIFKPFIWILNGIANFILKIIGITTVHGSEIHSSEELQYLVQQGQESGELDADEYKIIKNAFQFSEQTVQQIMVTRRHVFAINVEQFDENLVEQIIQEGYSRIPCYEGTIDNVIGVIYLRDLLLYLRSNDPYNIRSIVRKIMVVPETKSIGVLMKEFQANHQQMAVIVNEYGETEGIITMEDIIEELVGEIQDEYDNEKPIIERVGDKTYHVQGSCSLDDLNETLPRPIEKDPQYVSLAGYLLYKLGRIPSVKDKIVIDDYEFTILSIEKSTILQVQIHNIDDVELEMGE